MYLSRRSGRSVVQRASLVWLLAVTAIMCRTASAMPVAGHSDSMALSLFDSPPQAPRFDAHDTFFRVHYPQRLRHRRGWPETNTKRSARFAPFDEPVYLTNKFGISLIVTEDGEVSTTKQANPKDGEILRRIAELPHIYPGQNLNGKDSGKTLIVKYYLKAKLSERYICMNSRGGYYSNKEPTDECMFLVLDHANKHQSYCSAKYAGSRKNPRASHKRKWCIGISDSGKLRERVKPDRDPAQFMSRPVNRPVSTLPPYLHEIIVPTSPSNPKRNNKKNKNINKRKKNEDCTHEQNLFSVKCLTFDRTIRHRGGRRRYARGQRKHKPQRRPSLSEKSTFFST